MPARFEGHTLRRFDGELNRLHEEILLMADLVTEEIQLALSTFQHPDQEILARVNEKESQIDRLEKIIDNAITEVLAKEGPLAGDLRAVMAFSKMVTDLERLGDEAARIAQLSMKICSQEIGLTGTYMLRDVSIMGDHACSLLREAFEILHTLDLERAKALLACNDLGMEFCTSFRVLTSYVLEDTRNMRYIVNSIMILKSLERIGDHARNLAEYVVYMVSGNDVRHGENDG
jgi:phosphate transport system protein